VRLDYILPRNAMSRWLRAQPQAPARTPNKIECEFVAAGRGLWKTASTNKQRDGRPTLVGAKRLTEVKGTTSDIFRSPLGSREACS